MSSIRMTEREVLAFELYRQVYDLESLNRPPEALKALARSAFIAADAFLAVAEKEKGKVIEES